MKRKISLTLLLVLLLSLALVVFSGCGDEGDQSGIKQVPVYQGMTITSASGRAVAPLSYLSDKEDFDYDNDNGNHNGHFKGDVSEKGEDIDKENPFPENSENENIENEIKSSLNVVGSPDTIYYAVPGEDIYINIHIDNPDNFEIMSFTLNGKKYSTYMFEEGSDMETIVLKYNVGEASGIVEYTIDAIKYIDGTEIKDVIIDGNKTVMAGIKTENQVVANVSGVDIDTNAFVFNVNIKDNENLIAFSSGVLKAVVYDGFEIVAEKDLALGENLVSFDGLKTNTLYQYAVVGYYDDLSGDGFKMNVLYKDAFYTDSVVLFDNITVGQESINFGFLWHENYAGKAISALKLYQGDRLVATLDASATAAENLLSNNTYKLIAEYENGSNTESIYIEFTTLAKATPEIEIVDPTKTQTSVGFEITETDTDSVGAVTKIELVHASGTTEAESLDVRTFADLLSNNEYTVKVTYVYDLNDGEGEQTIVKELAITTDAKATPEIEIANPTKTQTSVGFEITETDTDSVGAVTKIELVHASGTTEAESLDVRTFADLLSNNEYTVKVTYVYDLNDGEGEQTVVKELAITTVAKATPEIEIANPTKTQTSVGFEITETDTDSVGAVTKIELVHASGTTEAESLDVRTFADLLSNNEYTVKVTYVYDLNDGEGEQTAVKELAITTVAKAAPSFEIKNKTITARGITADYDIADVDNILSYYKVELYKGDDLVSENADKEIDFSDLDYYTDYVVRFTYKYDVNDGEGEQTKTYDYEFKTLPYIDVTECSIANTSAVSEGETIFMQVKLNNPLGMAIESVVINGETYAVTGSSTTNKIFVEIVYNGQFAGGDTYLKIDKVNAKIDDTTLTVEPETELSDNVFINGKLDVLKIEFVNEDFEPIDWAFPSDTVYVLITLDNPTGYTVDSIVQVGSMVDENWNEWNVYESPDVSSLVRLDDNHWYYTVQRFQDGWNSRSIESLSYSNEYVTKTITYSNIQCSLYRVESNETKYISTPDDLKNMNGGYYYELTNDIDLSGIEWLGNPFDGVFNGKGYSIENMSFVGTVKNTSADLGLFSRGLGIIQNVNIKEATIIAEITSDDGSNYNAVCGAIIGHSEFMIIDNCTVDEYSILTVKNNVGGAYVGGLMGSGYAIITNCSNGASISATGLDVWAGGLAGNGNGTFTNCSNGGDVTATSTNNCGFVGGLAGQNWNGTFINCTNSGDVTATGADNILCVGGLTGLVSGIETFTNCSNSGDVTATSTNQPAYAGGLVGFVEGGTTATFINCTNSGDVTATGADNTLDVGGLTGLVSGIVTFTNCSNSGDVTATSTNQPAYAGGLVGFVEGGTTATFINCTNSGDVTAEVEYSYVGGLVGQISYGTVTITNCTNSGSVTATSTKSSAYLGGLVGQISYGTVTITNCTNSGDVTATNTDYYCYVGGLVGRIDSGTVTITNCTNSGDVTATSTGYDAYLGGLVGRIDSGTVTITNCTNSGDVTATSTENSACLGGLVGRIDSGTVTITYCTNSGNVTATSTENSACLGGLVGYIYDGTVTITNCTNSGSVTATNTDYCYCYVGGLVGIINNGTATITYCINSGSVTAEVGYSHVGGLVGEISYGTVTITNCTNSGDVTATSTDSSTYLGGLVGRIDFGTVTITNCTNSGNVTATSTVYDACLGGLVGYIYDGTVTITNSYSLTSGNSEYNGDSCTVEQLNSKEFYTETLGWSEDVWDFSELDVENGKYPTLKNN